MPKAEAKFILGAEDRTKRAFDSVMRRFGAASKAAVRLGRNVTAATTAAAIGSFAVTARDVIGFSNSIEGLSTRLGISQRSLMEYRGILERFQVPFSSFAMGLQRMQRRVSDAAAGDAPKVAEAIEELGLNVQDLAQMPLEQQFETVAAAMRKVKDEGRQTALTFALFDSEGVALLQLFKEAGHRLNALQKQQRALGNTLDKDGRKALERYRLALLDLRQVWRGLVTGVVVENIDAISDAVNAFTERLPTWVAAIREFAGTLSDWWQDLAPAAIAVANAFKTVIKAVAGFFEVGVGLFAMGKAAIKGDFALAKGIGDELSQRIFGGSEGFMTGGPSTLRDNALELAPGSVAGQEQAEQTMVLKQIRDQGVVGLAG